VLDAALEHRNRLRGCPFDCEGDLLAALTRAPRRALTIHINDPPEIVPSKHRRLVMYARTLALLAVGASLSGYAAAAPARSAPARPEPAVTIQRHAPLEEALERLHRATGGAFLAEIPAVERKLEKELMGTPLPEALQEVSQSFHLYWMRRGRGAAFLRRYVDPRELPTLELEEARAITSDLYRLVRGWSAFPIEEEQGRAQIFDNRRFVDSMTGTQLRLLQEQGLPFARLTAQQQAIWGRINNRQGFQMQDLELGRAAAAFSGWSQCYLAYLPLPANSRVPGVYLSFRHPTPTEGTVGIVLPESGKQLPPPPPPEPAGALMQPARERLPAAFRKPVRLPNGRSTLAELAKTIGTAIEAELRVPAYARERTLLAFVSGATAEEVVELLQDLYGYRLVRGTGRQYALERPRFAPARDVRDLHLRMRAAIPPCLHAAGLPEAADLLARAPRSWHHVALIKQDVTRTKGRDWTRAQVTELPPATQQRLANLVLLDFVRDVAQRPEPYWWLVAPEEGWFTLSGKPGPGMNPLLRFHVRRPDGKIDAWGWFLNTSSLDQ
jgi:hypothetical protein